MVKQMGETCALSKTAACLCVTYSICHHVYVLQLTCLCVIISRYPPVYVSPCLYVEPCLSVGLIPCCLRVSVSPSLCIYTFCTFVSVKSWLVS